MLAVALQAARDSLQSGEFGQTILDIDAAEAGLSQPASKPPSRSDLLWVVDFPMFEALDEEEWEGVGESKFPQYMSSHHPFTAPAPQDAEKLLAAASVVRWSRWWFAIMTVLKFRGLHFLLVP